MYIYYLGHVPYLLHVQVGGSSCQSRVMPRHRRGRVLACNEKKLQEAFPFFSHQRAVRCDAVLSLVVAVVRVGPWISNHLTQRRRVPKLPKTA